MKIHSGDIDTLARTLHGEARGEGHEGMLLVGRVIINRARKAIEHVQRNGIPHPLFGGGSIINACLARKQFSCWNKDDPNYEIISGIMWSARDFEPAVDAAWQAVKERDRFDRTLGALHYHTSGVTPAWSAGLTPSLVHGNHLFFNSVK